MQKVKLRNNVRIRLAKQMSFRCYVLRKMTTLMTLLCPPADRSMSEQQRP